MRAGRNEKFCIAPERVLFLLFSEGAGADKSQALEAMNTRALESERFGG